MNKTYAEVMVGQYKGRKGYIEETKATKVFNTVVFYSKEGKYPYRTVIRNTDFKLITEAEYLAE